MDEKEIIDRFEENALLKERRNEEYLKKDPCDYNSDFKTPPT